LEIAYRTVGWNKIVRDSRIMVDEKASQLVLSWTFVQKLLLAGRGVAKKEVWNAVPTTTTKENWFAYNNFYIGSSCFTLVLRCYTRDNLSFIYAAPGATRRDWNKKTKSSSRFFFKENVRYPIWIFRDPVCLSLGTRWQFYLILGTRFSILGTESGP